MGNLGERSGESTTENGESRDSAFSLREVWIAIVSNRWLVLAAFVAALVGAYAYTKTRVPMYSAYATIRMDPESPKPLGDRVDHVADIKGDYWDRQEYYNTVFQMLRAKSTAILVVRQLSLHKNRGFVWGIAEDEVGSQEFITVEQAAGMVSSRLGVSMIKDSRLATVSYIDANPERAARVLESILGAYIEVHEGEMNEVSTNAISWLEEQLTTLKGRLDKSELALHHYKKEKKILSVSADDQSEMLRAKMAQLTQALTAAEAARARIGARRAELRKIKGDDPSMLPAEELTDSDLLRSLREKYVLAYESVDALRAEGKGKGHPAVASAIARRDAAEKLLLAEVANVKESVEKDYAAISDEIGSLHTLYDAAKEQALELNLLAIEYKRLERARNTNQELFDLVTAKSKETGLTSHLRPTNVRIVDRPEIPGAPYSPNTKLHMLAGALGGLLLGLGLAMGREQLDSTIRRPDMVEEVFGLPFLGILPAMKSTRTRASKIDKRTVEPKLPPRSELATHTEPSGAMAEAVRAVRTNIMLGRGVSPETRVLLTTSAAPGDGKTTVACSLAISLAQAGQRVVLVDCDLRRPRLHRIFDKPNDSGVTSVLAGTLDVSDACQKTGVTGLSVLTSGTPPINPAELFHSERFAALLRDLRKNFDRIVIDSPPLIPVADATILATQADATVVVARAFETKKHTARRATQVLQDVNANVIGAVLNAVDFSRGEYRYYQYYDYSKARPARSNYPERS